MLINFYSNMALSRLFFLQCLGHFLYIVMAERSPMISYISQSQIKDIGDNVELNCSVRDYDVAWIKLNKTQNEYILPISFGNSLTSNYPKYSIQCDPNSSVYLLQIKDIQEKDAGLYRCQVLAPSGHIITADVELQVRGPPFIFANSTRSIVASEGEDVQIECYAGGYPQPTITWRRENNAILPTGDLKYSGNILKIKSIRKEDRGAYYCVAENGVGRGTKRNIAVQLELAPVLVVPRPRVGQALQFYTAFSCHIDAYPPPAITWEKDGKTLSSNQQYSISHFSVADEITDTTLRINKVEKQDYGLYVCKAVNKLGTATGRVELFETSERGCPPVCDTEE